MAAKKKKTSVKVAGTHTHPKEAHLITWIVVIALVVGLIGGYFVAKVRYTHYISLISVMFSQRDSQLNEMKAHMNQLNGITREGGKMMLVKNGKVKLMTEEVTLSDGTVVKPNGKYQKPGEKSVTMQNGEMMSMDGKMIEGDGENISF